MALIKCPKCGKEISDKAVNCPNCGREFSKQEKVKKDYYIISVVASILSIFLFVLFLILSDNISDIAMVIISLTHIIIFVIGILSLFKIITKRSEGRFCGGVCVLVSGFWVGILIYSVIALLNEDTTQMTDKEKIAIGSELLGKQTSDNSIEVTPEFDELADNMELFGYKGFLQHGCTADSGDIIASISWETNSECSDSDFKIVKSGLEELYGKSSTKTIFYEDIGNAYIWDNISEYQFVISGINNKNKVKIYWIDNIKDVNNSSVKHEESNEYGVEQMVGYNSLISLPNGSPVTVSGVAKKVTDGVYEIDIFEEDLDNVGKNDNWNKKTIRIHDPLQEIDYSNRYIDVNGHTDLSKDIPTVLAEKIMDTSEEFVKNGGTLP